MNDDILLTREQIGIALEYSDPINSIYKIHKRHQDRLDNLSFCLPDGFGHDIYYYTQKGIMEICRWSKSEKANQFMDWVWDIVEKYRNHELQTITQKDITSITTAITSISQAITTLAASISTMQKDIQELKQLQMNPYLLKKKYPSTYYQRMNPKYKLLMDYFNCTRTELYSSIYKELEDAYSVDIEQIYEEYCYENHLSKKDCFRMDAIEHNPILKDALTLLIDSSLIKYGLKTEEELKNLKRETLFDREPKKEKRIHK